MKYDYQLSNWYKDIKKLNHVVAHFIGHMEQDAYKILQDDRGRFAVFTTGSLVEERERF